MVYGEGGCSQKNAMDRHRYFWKVGGLRITEWCIVKSGINILVSNNEQY